jgi:hypothetical protein
MTTPGIYGAKRQSWYGKNPRDVLHRILLESPRGSEKEHFDRICDIVADDPAYFGAMIEYWFANNYRSMKVVEVSPDDVSVVPRQEERAASARRDEATVVRMKEKLYSALTMGFMMPNGERLKDCSFGYVSQMGGVFAAMAKGRKANEVVGKHLTDADLLNLQKRLVRNAVAA